MLSLRREGIFLGWDGIGIAILGGAVGALDVPVDIGDCSIGVGGGRGVQGDLVTVTGESEGTGGADVVQLSLSGGGLILGGFLCLGGGKCGHH